MQTSPVMVSLSPLEGVVRPKTAAELSRYGPPHTKERNAPSTPSTDFFKRHFAAAQTQGGSACDPPSTSAPSGRFTPLQQQQQRPSTTPGRTTSRVLSPEERVRLQQAVSSKLKSMTRSLVDPARAPSITAGSAASTAAAAAAVATAAPRRAAPAAAAGADPAFGPTVGSRKAQPARAAWSTLGTLPPPTQPGGLPAAWQPVQQGLASQLDYSQIRDQQISPWAEPSISNRPAPTSTAARVQPGLTQTHDPPGLARPSSTSQLSQRLGAHSATGGHAAGASHGAHPIRGLHPAAAAPRGSETTLHQEVTRLRDHTPLPHRPRAPRAAQSSNAMLPATAVQAPRALYSSMYAPGAKTPRITTTLLRNSHAVDRQRDKPTRGTIYSVFQDLDRFAENRVTYSVLEQAAVDVGMKHEQVKRLFRRLDPQGRGYATVEDWGRPELEGLLGDFTTLFVRRNRGANGRHKDGSEVQNLYAAMQMALFKLQLKNSGRNVSHERLAQAFEFIDRDRSGSLDPGEVVDAFHGLGIYMKQEVLDEAIRTFDKNGDGQVDYFEFIATLFPTLSKGFTV